MEHHHFKNDLHRRPGHVHVQLSYGFGLGLWWRIGASTAMAIAIAIVLMQIPLSAWWLSRARFGPVEWIWRRLTYGRPI